MKCSDYICDICGAKFLEPDGLLDIPIQKIREMAASGNGYETSYKYKDVCRKCATRILGEWLEKNIFWAQRD